MSQSVLLGGLFIGVLSALPIVNIANCCCLWILGGGMLTVYLAQQEDPQRLTLTQGARLGFRAGVVGAIVWLFASAVVDVMVSPLQQRAADLMLRNATDIPPEVRSWLEGLGRSSSVSATLILGLIFQLCIAAPFASLGGLLGAALLGNADQPQPL